VNIKEYIESGIIESCVLGLAAKAEQQQFEELCILHSEIVEARRTFELALEAELMKQTVVPPSFLKERIFQLIHTPATDSLHKKEKKPQTPILKMNVWKQAAAACILFLAGITYWAYSVNDKYQKLLTSNIAAANQSDHSSHADAIIALKTIVEKPTVKWSAMVAPTNSAHCMAHVYWDTLSKNTFLLLGNIPKPVSDRQFQLWALIKNRQVNLGTFNVKKEGQLIQMKNINNAKIFTITIEPVGESVSPDTKATYAVGEL